MNLKDEFSNWVVTHAQTIQNDSVHLACLKMQVARMNFDLILLPTSYVVWLRLPLPWYNDCMKLGWRRSLEDWANSSGKCSFAVAFPNWPTFYHFRVSPQAFKGVFINTLAGWAGQLKIFVVKLFDHPLSQAVKTFRTPLNKCKNFFDPPTVLDV